jgi:UDP-glucose 4-epimerase
MAKILVTGGAGFIGLHLAQALVARGERVDLLDNFGRGVRDAQLAQFLAQPGVRMLELNLLDADAVGRLDRDYDAIVHFAAIIGVVHVLQRPYEVLENNCRLLANAISLARAQKNLQRFVFASTSEVYAGTLSSFGMTIPTPEATPLTVSDLSHPRTSYMLSKIYGEAMCRQSQLPFTIVRPHNVYGPRMGMSHVVPELLKRAHEARDGDSLQVFSPAHRRTFCYIDDAVDLLVRILDTPACRDAVLNLGSTYAEVTIAELAQTVLAAVGRKLVLQNMPETPGSPARRAPDMTHARQLTGYQSRVGLESGVGRTYDWYRHNVFEGQGVTAR